MVISVTLFWNGIPIVSASLLLNEDHSTSSNLNDPLVNDVKIYHTDDPISSSELVTLLNEENFSEFTRHLKGLMSIYDNFQSESVNRSKIWLSLRALEEDLDVLAHIQGVLLRILPFFKKERLSL